MTGLPSSWPGRMLLAEDGYYDVPPGTVAAVVTFLEMKARPPKRAAPVREDLHLERRSPVDLSWYRRLYTAIGRDWLWFSRLSLTEAALRAVVGDPAVEVYALSDDRAELGLLELDFRQGGEVELAFFGLVPAAVGTGAGRWLMDRAISLAWRPGIERFWVHTCTLDHPDAVKFYRRSGFAPYRLAVEIAPDPRLAGVLPRDAAPQVPLIAS